jgi:hypothetical protein
MNMPLASGALRSPHLTIVMQHVSHTYDAVAGSQLSSPNRPFSTVRSCINESSKGYEGSTSRMTFDEEEFTLLMSTIAC